MSALASDGRFIAITTVVVHALPEIILPVASTPEQDHVWWSLLPNAGTKGIRFQISRRVSAPARHWDFVRRGLAWGVLVGLSWRLEGPVWVTDRPSAWPSQGQLRSLPLLAFECSLQRKG
jgi:hypothetical protein